MGKYYCEICGKVSKQKSHHEAHLESELHLTKVENFYEVTIEIHEILQ